MLYICICKSSTTKTGHHDLAEILLKVALNTKNQIKKSINLWMVILISNLTLVVQCASAGERLDAYGTLCEVTALVVEEAEENHRPWASNW
jgi:hypothetical protein